MKSTYHSGAISQKKFFQNFSYHRGDPSLFENFEHFFRLKMFFRALILLNIIILSTNGLLEIVFVHKYFVPLFLKFSGHCCAN